MSVPSDLFFTFSTIKVSTTLFRIYLYTTHAKKIVVKIGWRINPGVDLGVHGVVQESRTGIPLIPVAITVVATAAVPTATAAGSRASAAALRLARVADNG